MNTTYHYVVLRLAADRLRGEVINVGVALWHYDSPVRVVTMATLSKLRAIDATWDTARMLAWARNIEAICSVHKGAQRQIEALARFGFCTTDAAGMFHADSETALKNQLAQLRLTYVANCTQEKKPKREKRTRLQTLLREQFERMQVLGHDADDLASHLVVPNVPAPSCPELKSDFVYKNGVYRITQTIDYHVSPDSLHQKLQEACVKSTAAEMAMKTYGHDTLRFAVLDIPQEYEGTTDSHVDLLQAQGFQVFRFGNQSQMASYMSKATPAVNSARLTEPEAA